MRIDQLYHADQREKQRRKKSQRPQNRLLPVMLRTPNLSMSFGRTSSEGNKRNTTLSNGDCRNNGINNSISNSWHNNKQSATLKSSEGCKKSSNGSPKSSL